MATSNLTTELLTLVKKVPLQRRVQGRELDRREVCQHYQLVDVLHGNPVTARFHSEA